MWSFFPLEAVQLSFFQSLSERFFRGPCFYRRYAYCATQAWIISASAYNIIFNCSEYVPMNGHQE